MRGVWGRGDWLSSEAGPRYGRDMADAKKETREERLAKALRENLKRRKAQARKQQRDEPEVKS